VSFRLTAYGRTDPGRVRSSNQDDVAIVDLAASREFEPPECRGLSVRERGVLLAVTDGVGGYRAGEVAAELALESLAEEMEVLESGCPAGDLFRAAVENVNRRVWERGRLDPMLEGMATTLTSVVVCRKRALVAHVGDSRAYFLRGGQIRQITRDHSLVAEMVSAGALTKEQAEKSPFRNLILQAIGRKKTVEVALDGVDLEPGDLLLLCTDGLSEKVSSEEMARLLQSHGLRDAVDSLITLANDRGGEDNIAVVAGRIEEETQ
jgi:serine/threonine protein phosphatase PrpC